uniref:hypothetical protein n=1 Tax=Rheinheimera sp. TaxID=1869214 RepID=UPI00404715D9
MTEQKINVKPQPKDYGHEYDLANPLDQLSCALERKLADTIYERGTIDTRMIEDLRAYHGLYDENTEKELKEAKRAKPFVKLTRAKTNAAESQLVDLLFPNDDKNWGMNHTPVPELAGKLNDEKPAMVDGQEYTDAEGNVITRGMLAQRELEIIKERCANMELEIEDQLIETDYNAKSRDCIHDAVVIGTGVLKGPVIVGSLSKAFVETEMGWAMEMRESFTPGVEVVRPWDFFPDMSAASIDEAEFVFERRYMSKAQLQGLTQRKGFKAEQIKKVLQLTGQQTQHTSVYQDDVRRLAGLSDTLNDTRYETWEYHGPISFDVLVELGVIELPEDADEAAAAMEKMDQQDMLATVFYCGGIVLGAKLHAMQYEGYLPYRVFNWEPDDSSIFGYGVPRMVKDEQSIINSVWRMILDNGAITAGPQIIRRRKHVAPANGSNDWALVPFKQWDLLSDVEDVRKVFTAVEFNSRLPELQGIYSMARVLFDEISGVPMLQQGEQGQSTQTLGGMSMLMNAANTVRRRQVKAWDDCITKPMITDFYAWNMENSDKADIKGDYLVDARGTGALLVKETQAQAITNMLQVIGSNPVFSPILQLKSVQIFREWFRTQSLPSDLLPSDEELEQYQKQMAEQQEQGPQDPAIQVEQMRMQAQQAKFEFEQAMFQQKMQLDMQTMQASNQIKSQQIAADMQAAASKERVELMKLAQNDKLSSEKLIVELKKNEAKLEQDWQRFIAELQVKQTWGDYKANYGLTA